MDREPGAIVDARRDVLVDLAGRIRERRGSLGWSRLELSRRSGLSSRFLAQVESGEGNISLLRLQALAGALGTSIEQLIRPRRDPSRVVILVGLRGAGKSTVGPRVARRLGRRFAEMDRMITEVAGLSADQIFELHGERHYRRLEREVIDRILADDEAVVVAASGGIVNDPVSWSRLNAESTVVWLKAEPEDHWNRVIAQGDRRPMADNPDAMQELRAMLQARAPLYATAETTIDTHGRDAEAVADAVCAALSARSVSVRDLPDA